mmetsp:Transcript_29485/g.78011  ORF Transcript_29485/g.78011 Transcript_29485/m.78011 type:complete len:287 (+) Transcript_29485:458-1318(+)
MAGRRGRVRPPRTRRVQLRRVRRLPVQGQAVRRHRRRRHCDGGGADALPHLLQRAAHRPAGRSSREPGPPAARDVEPEHRRSVEQGCREVRGEDPEHRGRGAADAGASPPQGHRGPRQGARGPACRRGVCRDRPRPEHLVLEGPGGDGRKQLHRDAGPDHPNLGARHLRRRRCRRPRLPTGDHLRWLRRHGCARRRAAPLGEPCGGGILRSSGGLLLMVVEGAAVADPAAGHQVRRLHRQERPRRRPSQHVLTRSPEQSGAGWVGTCRSAWRVSGMVMAVASQVHL